MRNGSVSIGCFTSSIKAGSIIVPFSFDTWPLDSSADRVNLALRYTFLVRSFVRSRRERRRRPCENTRSFFFAARPRLSRRHAEARVNP